MSVQTKEEELMVIVTPPHPSLCRCRGRGREERGDHKSVWSADGGRCPCNDVGAWLTNDRNVLENVQQRETCSRGPLRQPTNLIVPVVTHVMWPADGVLVQ